MTGTEVPALVRALVVHMDQVEGAPRERRDAEPFITDVSAMLKRLHELDPAPPSMNRSPEARLMGHCRTTSVLGCALLRELEIPSRVRAGHAVYYADGRDFYGDHWVIDVWDEKLGRWRLADAELDAQTRAAHDIDFDPDDVPEDQFLVAGHAWLDCRQERREWHTFGPYPSQTGRAEVAAQLVRDAESLVGHEVGPFDKWLPQSLSDDALTVLDDVAAATLDTHAPDAGGVQRCRDLREAHDWLIAPGEGRR